MKNIYRGLLSSALLLPLLTPGVAARAAEPLAAAAVAAESAKANAFFDQVFDEAVARSPMTMGALGIKKDMDQWDDISEARALEDFALTVQHFAELKQQINFALLDDQAKVSYRLFVKDAERSIEGWKWRHYNYPLNQMSGLHSEAAAFLINYHPITTVAEARAYIARLRGLARLFDQLIVGVELRAAKNIIPPRFVFPLVIESIKEVISGQPFVPTEKSSALWEDFSTKVGALSSIDAATRVSLLAEARAALVEVVGPAYEKLIKVLVAQQQIATDDDGVWGLADMHKIMPTIRTKQ